MTAPAISCRVRTCSNRTLDPSGACHHHRDGMIASERFGLAASTTPVPATGMREHLSAEEALDELGDFSGIFGDCPDAIELLAERLGVHESEIVYYRAYLDPSRYSPGASDFDDEREREYVRRMARSILAGDELPPLLVAEGEHPGDRGVVVDGNHRAAAYAESGVPEMYVIVGARSRSFPPKNGTP